MSCFVRAIAKRGPHEVVLNSLIGEKNSFKTIHYDPAHCQQPRQNPTHECRRRNKTLAEKVKPDLFINRLVRRLHHDFTEMVHEFTMMMCARKPKKVDYQRDKRQYDSGLALETKVSRCCHKAIRKPVLCLFSR